MNLWLDDLRDPANYGLEGWTWVKSVAEAQAVLSSHTVQKASLDHDLGACDDCYRSLGIDPQDPDKAEMWLGLSYFKEMPNCDHFGTGYDLCLWMAEHGIWPVEKPVVHSANPVGRDRMRGVIDRYFPEREDA